MSLRPEEEYAANALKSHLGQSGFSARWEPCCPDPPDVTFWVAPQAGAHEERWGCEITTLHQYADSNDQEVNLLDYWSRLEQCVNQLNCELKQELRYSYALTVDLPIEQNILRALPDRVRGYIRSGSTQEELLDRVEVTAQFNLQGYAQQVPDVFEGMINQASKVRIAALNGGREIFLMAGIKPSAPLPGATTMTGDVQAACDYAVRRALEAKLRRLERVSGFDSVCLMLVASYPLITAAEVRNSIQAFEGDLSILSSIYFVASDTSVVLVCP